MKQQKSDLDMEAVALLKILIVELTFQQRSMSEISKKNIDNRLNDFSDALDAYIILKKLIKEKETNSGFTNVLYKAINENETLKREYDWQYMKSTKEYLKEFSKTDLDNNLYIVHKELSVKVPKTVVASFVSATSRASLVEKDLEL